MRLEIDQNAGFCFGVTNAIKLAEDYLKEHSNLYCLGDIVHNEAEVERLKKLGLRIISYEQFRKLEKETVLIRAHGEPLETYKIAWDNQIYLLEGTCPIVVRLQKMICKNASGDDDQIVLFGKKNHPEAIGLASQVDGQLQVVEDFNDLQIDYSKPVQVYSQTTMDGELYGQFCDKIRAKSIKQGSEADLFFQNSVCGQVASRSRRLRDFAKKHDIIIFVSGKNSSNGNYLYNISRKQNDRTYFVRNPEEIEAIWLDDVDSVGISGATSTPEWLMKDVAEEILKYT